MHFLYGIFIFAFAGVMNGSFALPSKRLTQWPYQRIWLHYSIWAFLVFPLLLLFVFAPSAWHVYAQASLLQIAMILTGGVLFGIGQICFARAIQTIGLGLGFLVNISIGTALGSLIPLLVQHARHVLTASGLMTITAIVLIILGVFISYVAGLKRDQNARITTTKNYFSVGMTCAIIAGLFSAIQNITFSFTIGLQHLALDLGSSSIIAANIIWPAFLLAAFIPYAGYMIYLQRIDQSGLTKVNKPSYFLATIMMGAFWYFSLILYSAGSLKLGALGPVIGWPLFMVCIIMTANMWGWRQGEWLQAPVSAKRLAKLSVLTLILSIVVLAYATFLRH